MLPLAIASGLCWSPVLSMDAIAQHNKARRDGSRSENESLENVDMTVLVFKWNLRLLRV